MEDVQHTGNEEHQEDAEPPKHSIDVHVGGRLRLRRTIVGMTQTSLAARLGLTFQQIQKYERGTNRISASRLYEIAGLLEVPLSFFFDDALYSPAKEERLDIAKVAGVYRSDRVQGSVVDASLYDRETSDLIRAYYRVKNVAVRKHLLALIRSMQDGEPDDPPQ